MNDIIIYNDYVEMQKKRFIDRLKTDYKKEFPLVSFSEMRLQHALTNSTNLMKISLRENTGSDDKMELKLEISEFFIPLYVAMYLQKYDPTDQEDRHSSQTLFPYVDENFFTGAGEAAALKSVFQGQISFKTGGTHFIEKILTSNFEQRPQSQYLTGAQSGGAIVQPESTGGFETKGFYNIHNDFILDGSQNNEIHIELGQEDISAINGPDADTLKNRLVVIVKGFRCTGEIEVDKSPLCSVAD